MSTQSIIPANQIFQDIDGQPLENGYIYLGTAGLEPIANPISLYWDAALAVPATQPIRTTAGFPVNAGSPSRIYVDATDYSLLVSDKNNATIVSSLNNADRISGSNIIVKSVGASSVNRTLASKLSDSVSVKDFGATGDGVTDDSAAIQLAIDSQAKRILFPKGVYLCATALTYTNSANSTLILQGDNTTNWTTDTDGSIIKYTGSGIALKLDGNSSPIHTEILNLGFVGTASATNGVQIFEAWFVKIKNCLFKSFSAGNGINLTFGAGTAFTGITDIDGCAFSTNLNAIIADKYDTNVLNVIRNQFTANTKCVVSGTSAGATASRNFNIQGNTFDGNTGEIYSYGAAQGWNINENYFERAVIGTEPVITITSNGASGTNSGVRVCGNTFSVALTATMTYMNFDFIEGLYVLGNYSAYGDEVDRFSVTITNSNTENNIVAALTCPSGVVPFANKINGTVKSADGGGEYTPAFGGGATFGAPSTAYGYYNKINDRVTVDVFMISSGAPTGSTGSTLSISLPANLIARGAANYKASGSISYTSGWSTAPDYVNLVASGAAVTFGIKNSATAITAADMAGGIIMFTISYATV